MQRKKNHCSMNKVLALLTFCFSLSAQLVNAKHLADKIYANESYSTRVGAVQLFPMTSSQSVLRPPIVPLGRGRLMLRFDLLDEEYTTLSARIVHCDADWTQSSLNEIDFINQYNAFDILDYDYSINTLKLYVHYWFQIPALTKSGNYVVQVYEDNDKRKVLFQRRFVLYETAVSIDPTLKVPNNVSHRRSHHQIDFNLHYGGLGNVENPMVQLKPVIRQNNRWDNSITGLRPMNLNVSDKSVEYKFFDGSSDMLAGNEFRYFDVRTTSIRGMFVSNIDRRTLPFRAELSLAEKRSAFYSHLNDQNGYFVISTRETGARELEADYIHVTFRLKSEPILEPVYVTGAFNDWSQNDQSMMAYDPQSKMYFRTFLLKQGWYDYQYTVDGASPLLYEGSFMQTRNEYDIILYYRSFTDVADRVVGYTSFLSEL